MNVSVLIGSCDAYSPLWPHFDTLFRRYWKLDTKNVLVSETLTFDNDLYQTALPGKLQWGERMLLALNEIDTEYTVFLLEDYFFTEPITQEFIDDHIRILESYNAQKIMIDINAGEPFYTLEHLQDDLYKFKLSSDHLNSIQPSVWKTEYLKQVLKPEYSPWQFEVDGNAFTQTLNPTIILKARSKPVYFNFVRVGGRVSEGWEEICRRENLNF